MRRGVNSWRRAVGARAGGFADEVGDGRLPPASRLVEPHRIGISVDVGVGLQHDCALADTHAGQRRHGIEQRAEAPVGVQEAADEATFLAAAPMLQHRDAPGRRPVDVLDRHWSEAGLAGEHVLYAARENYNVTGFDGDRRHAAPLNAHCPCVAIWNGVSASAGEQPGGQHLRRRGQYRPGMRELGAEMDGRTGALPAEPRKERHHTSRGRASPRWGGRFGVQAKRVRLAVIASSGLCSQTQCTDNGWAHGREAAKAGATLRLGQGRRAPRAVLAGSVGAGGVRPAPAGEVLGTDARKEAAEILRGLIERITVRDDPNGHRVELTVVIL